MALQDCIKKLGVVSKPDQKKLQQFLEEGLTDEQAVRRLLIESNVDVIDIASRAREAGAVVRDAPNVLAEVRSFQNERLQKLLVERAGIEDRIAESNAEYGDMAQNLAMFNDHLQTKVGWTKDLEDMSDSEVRMAIGQLLFNPTVRSGLARGVLGIQGTTVNQIFDSLQSYRNSMIANRRAHGGLINEYSKVGAQVDALIAGDVDTFFQELPPVTRDYMGLFSGLEKVVSEMNLPEWKAGKEAKGKVIAQKLRKVQGVKKEELEWTGLLDMLEAAPEEKWSREAVRRFVQANGVEVEETITDPDMAQAVEDLDWDDGTVWDADEAWEGRAEDLLYEFDQAYPPTGPEDEYLFFSIEKWFETRHDDIVEDYDLDEDQIERLDGTMDTLAEVLADNKYDLYADYKVRIRDDAKNAANEQAYNDYMEEPLYVYEAYGDGVDMELYIFGNSEQGFDVRDGGTDWSDRISGFDEPVYSLSEAQIRAEEYAREAGYLRDEESEFAPRWGGYVEERGGYANYREVKIKLPEIEGQFTEPAHFGDEENIVMFMRVTDRMLPNRTLWTRTVGVPLDFDPAAMGLRELSPAEAKFNHEQGSRIIMGTPTGDAEGNRTGYSLQPMRETGLPDAFFNAERAAERGDRYFIVGEAGNRMSTYFIDEAQSDWHQQGRQYGYVDDKRVLELDEQDTELGRQLGEISDKWYAMYAEWASTQDRRGQRRETTGFQTPRPAEHNAGDFRAGMNLVATRRQPMSIEYFTDDVSAPQYAAWITQNVSQTDMDKYRDIQRQRQDVRSEAAQAGRGVADVPFKGDAWLALGLKRALVQAIEEGNDQFAWADAETLGNRWSSRYEEMYGNQYDKKMPSIIRKLTGQKPEHLGPDGAPARPGENGYWKIDLTPELKEQIRTEGFPLFQGERGSITFDAARKATINLYEAADFSTFIHEAGHLYLELMGSLAERMDASEQVLHDWNIILSHLNVRNRSEITREHHELFARSFEKYAMEGKAPSQGLQDAFNAFRRWLGEIYRRIAGVRDIELPDDIRGVMDRMLATDAEIKQAEARQEMTQLFGSAEEMDVSPEVFEVYRRSVERAHDDAVQSETVKVLAEMKRDELEWYKEESKKVEAEVAAEVHSMRVYSALYLLSRGTRPDGSALEPPLRPFKLDRESLLDLFQGDKDILKMLPHTGQYGIYRREGGVDVDVAAQRLGFVDGRAMIEAILKAAPMEDVIKAETSRRMDQIYPDPFKDGSLAEMAVNAVHNERRAQVLAAEMRQLRKLQRRDRQIVRATERAAAREEREDREIAKEWVLPKRAEVAMIKVAAQQSIGNKKIRDVNPNVYLNAERKAGRLAFEAMAKKDYPTAYMYKRMQLVNHEMYRAAIKAKDRAAKTQKYLTKFESKRVQQRLGRSDVLDKILSVLEGIDFRKRSLKSIDQKNLEIELARAIDDGELVMPPGVLDRVFDDSVNWQELTVEEFEATRDLVKQLEKQAKAEVEAIVNGEKVNLQARASEIAEQLYDNNKKVDMGVGDPTRRDRTGKLIKQGVTAWLRPSSIARVLDKAGFGAVTRNVIVPMRRAYAEKLIPGLHKAQADVSTIYRNHFTNEQLRVMHKKRYRVESQNETYSHSDLLSLALNWGNQGNREAVLAGKKRDGSPAFTDTGVREMLANLTENDWAFVQEVWDYLETYWPEIRDAERRRRGIAPKQVEPSPFTVRTADGKEVTMRGGYYPLKYAREHSDRTKLNEYEDVSKNMQNGVYVTANTRAGATYERSKSGGQVVRLSLNVLDNHLREIVRDIAIGDEVNYLKRLLNNKDVRNAFVETGNQQALDTLQLWLTDSAVGELPSEGFWEGTTAWIRTGFTKAKLGWNLMTTMLQFTGFTQSMAVIGSKNMAIGLGKFMRNPTAVWPQVMERSRFLNTRYKVGAWNKDVQDTKAHLEAFFGAQPTTMKVSMNWLAHTYFLPIAKAQQVVDITTWLGAYEKGVNEMQLSEADAIIFADTQVEAAQTSGFFSDRSGLERGTLGLRKNRQSQYIRIWTTLISYMLAKGNLAYEKTKNTNFRRPSEVLSYFTDLVLLYTVEGIASALLYAQLPEDDDAEDWAAWVALRTADSIVSGVPFVREIPSSRFSGGNTPIGAFAKDSYELAVQLGQGEPDEAMRKALYNVTGTAFHIPSGQLGRTLEAIWFEDDPEWWEYISGVKDR